MLPKDIRDQFAQKLNEEAGASQEVCLWMSFCDPEKPKGQQFLGVVVMKTLGIAHAIDRAWKLGINPGGEVLGYEMDGSEINPDHFDKLLTQDDLVAAGYIDPIDQNQQGAA
jgi:hypothetical protein